MPLQSEQHLADVARALRYYILACTTKAQSGHPTSSLSAVELVTMLFFGGFFRTDLARPDNPNNDRLIFSKGHASPLYYALYTVCGVLREDDLITHYRTFGSPLEGHPRPNLSFVEAATGSLGQGLSIGVGFAMNAKYLDKLPYRTYVLLGDSEMAEGSQWEAIQISAHYDLDNLVGILDVNRLGQRGETMYGHDLRAYERRISAFGWRTIVIDGHSFPEIEQAYAEAVQPDGRPTMIIASTMKGKGVTLVENKDGWHGKTLSQEQFDQAKVKLGTVDTTLRAKIAKPDQQSPQQNAITESRALAYTLGDEISTRKAYGKGLARLGGTFPQLVALDAEVSNSTFSEEFQKAFPERFFEMYVAEQNMVGVALGLSRRGKIPCVSTFAAFFTRAFDQIRMAQYSLARIVFAGSHVGVSIGQDGPSQMGLEDIAMFRTLRDSMVFYPSDAVSCEKLLEQALRYQGISYIRTTRMDTPVLYASGENFAPGGSKTIYQSEHDVATLVAAGVTLHESLKVYKLLKENGINVRVIDLYSIKPIDQATLLKAASETNLIVTVEDHYAEGGLGEAVQSCLSTRGAPIHVLAVRKMPSSGTPAELLAYQGLSAGDIASYIQQQL